MSVSHGMITVHLWKGAVEVNRVRTESTSTEPSTQVVQCPRDWLSLGPHIFEQVSTSCRRRGQEAMAVCGDRSDSPSFCSASLSSFLRSQGKDAAFCRLVSKMG